MNGMDILLCGMLRRRSCRGVPYHVMGQCIAGCFTALPVSPHCIDVLSAVISDCMDCMYTVIPATQGYIPVCMAGLAQGTGVSAHPAERADSRH